MRSPSGANPPAPVVLVVDDMAEVGLIVGRLGRPFGYTVVHYPRAELAWEELRQVRPDLVLLDVNLPGMNGLELCRRLRATPDLADLAVAVFSSGMQPEEMQAARAAGADFILSKDLLAQPEVWQHRLREILGR